MVIYTQNEGKQTATSVVTDRKGYTMFEVMWQEFNRKNQVVTKRKGFRSEAAMDKFINKLHDKDNFWQIIGYRRG